VSISPIKSLADLDALDKETAAMIHHLAGLPEYSASRDAEKLLKYMQLDSGLIDEANSLRKVAPKGVEGKNLLAWIAKNLKRRPF
jgi:hypothetical protein